MPSAASIVLASAILAAMPIVARAADRDVPLTTLDLSRLEQGWGEPQVDRSVEEKPLSIGGAAFAHGLGSHADSRFQIAVNGAKRFLATVGIDDDTEKRGRVRFLVVVDGKTVVDSGPMKGGDAAKAIDVSLAGASEMLLVTRAEGGQNYAHADWAEARFVVDGEAPSAIALPNEVAEILTPPAPRTPRINGARIFGVRPGSPILFTVPATGERPIRFEATGLPDGATFDAATGRLGGAVAAAGTYVVHLKATNARGDAERELRLVVGDELALTPPMGWNSWNCFAGAVDAEKIRSAADAMVASGLIDHGWSYVNVDDYWQQSPARMAKDPTLGGPGRDAAGNIVPNPRFPDMKGLADYVHAKGLRFGVYSSPGPLTCGRCLGSFGFEAQDAATYAAWGVDYLKYDWCSYRPEMETRRASATTQTAVDSLPKPADSTTKAQAIFPYARMGELLRNRGRDIVYSLCQYGNHDVWDWGATVGGDAWRTTGDITDTWSSLSGIGFSQPDKQGVTGPGHWSDPDMLVVGRLGWGKPHATRLTPDEQYTHLSLWSILSAPLLIGCDMTQLDPFTINLLSNDEVIAVDQDPLGRQAKRVAVVDSTEVWSKELDDGALAVGLFNRGESQIEITANWSDLGLTGGHAVRDLWRQQDVGTFDGRFSSGVPRHGVRFVRISK